jgi:hypothetical protein
VNVPADAVQAIAGFVNAGVGGHGQDFVLPLGPGRPELEDHRRRHEDPARNRERRCQADLLRCIFGNPFRPAVIPAAMRTWRDGLAVSMARRISDARDFSEMAVLGDVLEDAGCHDARVLAHLRNTDLPHARGCPVLDALLGLK